MCGRLPRDTLIAAHAPEVPSTVVSADVAYFFRWVAWQASRQSQSML
jgi:hypothetical protein